MKYIKRKNVLGEKQSDLATQIIDKFSNCSDFLCKKIVSAVTNVEIYEMSINQFVDKLIIDEAILKPISDNIDCIYNSTDLLNVIKSGKIYHMDFIVETDVQKLVSNILAANFVIILDNVGYIFNTVNFAKRSIEKPESEVSIKGAKESFIEAAAINVSLVRRRLQSSDLKVIENEVGTEIKTKVSVMYMESLAKPDVVQKILDRIKNMRVPCIISIADFEEHISDRKYSIFPQIIATERPDKIAANLAEGKVAIFVDGFPTGYIAPSTLSMFMQASEEYNINYFVGSFIRLLRYMCILVAALLPALYIAITTFHHEMLPTTLAESIIQSKQNVPLPAFLEIVIMLVAFEILLEAGNRMPKVAGQAVSIVGALIVGEAAVNAKFVSPIVVVIVAITAICGFVIPNRDLANAIRLTRVGLVIVSSIAGFYGISIGTITLVYYLCSLESFGVPYLKPFVASDGKKVLADTIFREPIKKSKEKMVRW